jgi:peroxiredoxin
MDNLTDQTPLDKWVEERLSGSAECHPDLNAALSRYKQRRDQIQKHRVRLLRGAVAFFICSLIISGVPQTSALAKKCAVACAAGTARFSHFVLSKVSGTSSETVLPARERQVAPDFALADQNGQTRRLSDFRGRVVLLNFWATWCKPCRTEMPWFADLYRQYRSQKFSVIAVAMDDEGWPAVQPFISKLDVSFPVMIGGDSIASLFGGLNAVPTTLAIDKSGHVAAINIGIQQRQKYEAELQALLSEQ